MPARQIILAISIMALIFISSCGDGNNQSQNSQQPPTTASRIEALEETGKIPKLDRSENLKGPDTNNNGIRDDIDSYIAVQSFSPTELKAAQQIAKALQFAVTVDINNKNAILEAKHKNGLAVDCAFQVFGMSFFNRIAPIEAITANTKQRILNYADYNDALDGKNSSPLRKDTCE